MVDDSKKAPFDSDQERTALQALFDVMPQLGWTAKANGDIDYYNRGWYDYTGKTFEELSGWGWKDVHDPAVLPAVMERWNESLATGTLFEMQFPLRRHDGEMRWFLTRISPMRDEQGDIVRWIGINTDIHDEKMATEQARALRTDQAARAEQERSKLEEARRAAEAANRAKDEFLAMLGHELRNPLAPMLTAIELQREKEPDITRERAIIERQVRHLKRMVDDLLDVSRIAQGKIELRTKRVLLSSVVESACEMVQPVLEAKKQALDARVDGPAIWLRADETRLVQVLTNLLTNASKYSPEGATVKVRASAESDSAKVTVGDEGIGIDPTLLPRVFDLFHQGTQGIARSRGGLGLGLAIVKSLVELHGGSAWATSEGAGKGSTFGFRVPRLSSTAARRTSVVDVASPYSAPLSVLLVDDNKDAVELLGMALAARGHQVAVEYDGLAGVARAEKDVPQVAILDIGLPGIDGNEMARRIRANGDLAGMVLIALTGYGQAEDRARAEAAGFDHFLVKPVELENLTALVSAAAARL